MTRHAGVGRRSGTNGKDPSHESNADVVVLGVGTSGEDISLRLLGAGLDVVGIEAALVGGECPYWACLPSKMMIRAANALQEARRINGLGGGTGYSGLGTRRRASTRRSHRRLGRLRRRHEVREPRRTADSRPWQIDRSSLSYHRR